jgi:hypothetical protein
VAGTSSPLVPHDKAPAIKGWPEQATTDPEQIAAWWARRPCNIGIATGPSRLVVVDCDTFKPGDRIPDRWRAPGITSGLDVLAALADQHHQPFPADTFTVATASGGTHLYFTHPDHGPELRNTAGKLGFRIDTRAARGMVVAPGSTTPKGRYTVLSAAPVAPLPGWIARLLAPAPRPAVVTTTPRLATGRGYIAAALDNECANVATATGGGAKNQALMGAARALSRFITSGELTQLEVEEALRRAAATAGIPDRKALSVISSAITWATTNDRRRTA